MTFLFDTIAVVGVGLIGGSLARAVRTNRLARSITGIDTDTRNLRLAEELGVVDTGTADLSHGVRDANLVVIATPVRSIVPLTEQISRFAARDAIIT
ncbi:MAG TPA: prephenate dehydrogenase/arogenate dehydrogenase family protein, partial [Thermodesulfobacteriota bacterium]|nr:prephenate dehydrogenase/arogenate dehydrogenase family protein [Thermodesulfobacteriota bacterium]